MNDQWSFSPLGKVNCDRYCRWWCCVLLSLSSRILAMQCRCSQASRVRSLQQATASRRWNSVEVERRSTVSSCRRWNESSSGLTTRTPSYAKSCLDASTWLKLACRSVTVYYTSRLVIWCRRAVLNRRTLPWQRTVAFTDIVHRIYTVSQKKLCKFLFVRTSSNFHQFW